MLVRRSVFERVGGFEEAYSRQFQDHDLCLKLRDAGRVRRSARRLRGRSITRRRRSAARTSTCSTGRCSSTAGTSGSAAGDPYYGRGFFREAADYTPPPFGGDALELAMREAAR